MGFTPSEHSSGENERKGDIAKVGNRRLRKSLAKGPGTT
ncbi:transposase [uncultured Slackia sp.]